MSELVLLILRLAFLVLLWGFVFAIVTAVRRDIFGGRKAVVAVVPSAPQVVPIPESSRVAANLEAHPRRLVVTAGPQTGKVIPLDRDTISIGRSADSDLAIHDDYTSTQHARLLFWNGSWMLQDLDSTNGTFLDGQRVSAPVPVPLGEPVTIGHTTFELRS